MSTTTTTMMTIEDRIAEVEEILGARKIEIGRDYVGYKNHVYRMVNFCLALRECSAEERTKILIAGCFHDLGIWTSNTFDYLPPSQALAQAWLQHHGLGHWVAEIELMIALHHKLSRYRDPRYPLVEVFRQGDLVDFSLGLVRCSLPATYIQAVKRHFPNAGFHLGLVRLEGKWFSRHPFNPLPIVKL